MVRRRDLDEFVAENAVKAGATLWQGTEAIEPLLDRGFVRGAVIRRKDSSGSRRCGPQYVVVADGANSRFGRALGTYRDARLALRHRHPRLLGEPAARRALDRVRP